MIHLDLLRAVRLVISHEGCPDGLASALLLKDALPDAEIQFVQYGTEAHRGLEARPGMLFCDFSPLRERADEFARAGAIVLDHHRTAKDVVLAMGERGVFADEEREPGVAGAVLAFRHVWLPLREGIATRPFAEHFASVAGVRDTWQTKSPLWREGLVQTELLRALPRTWWLGRSLADIEAAWPSLAPLGESLVAKQEDRVRRAVAQALRYTTANGERVVAMAGVSLTSDAAELIDRDADLVIGFDYGVEAGSAKIRFSLRSHTTFDCAAFAARFGGGGHTRAAGFSVVLAPSDPQPYTMIARLLPPQP